MNDNQTTEVNVNTYLKVVKFILVIACLSGTIFRIKIDDKFVNIYMAVVNIASFLTAINLCMIECYFKWQTRSKEICNNILKKSRIENITMILYISIFIINVVLVVLMFILYFVKCYDITVLNDCLGIISLGFALTTDFLSDFLVGIVSFFE